jgi:hypothetical protein
MLARGAIFERRIRCLFWKPCGGGEGGTLYGNLIRSARRSQLETDLLQLCPQSEACAGTSQLSRDPNTREAEPPTWHRNLILLLLDRVSASGHVDPLLYVSEGSASSPEKPRLQRHWAICESTHRTGCKVGQRQPGAKSDVGGSSRALARGPLLTYVEEVIFVSAKRHFAHTWHFHCTMGFRGL